MPMPMPNLMGMGGLGMPMSDLMPNSLPPLPAALPPVRLPGNATLPNATPGSGGVLKKQYAHIIDTEGNTQGKTLSIEPLVIFFKLLIIHIIIEYTMLILILLI